jgi:hypothetical protein
MSAKRKHKTPPALDARTPAALLDPLRRYRIDDAAAYLGISRAQLYIDIRTSKIATITDGKRRFVPGSEIVRLSSVAA